MSRYRKVDPRIWNDAKFRRLSDDGKLAFFMLLTHPHMTALGAMRAMPSGMASEMAWAMGRWEAAIEPAERAGMVVIDRDAAFIWLPNFLRYNKPNGPNEIVKAWPAALDFLPECSARTRLCKECLAMLDGMSDAMRHAIGDAIRDALAMACRIPEPEPEPEQEQEKDLPTLAALATAPSSIPPTRIAKGGTGGEGAGRGLNGHGHALALDALPEEWRAWASANVAGLDVDRTWAMFADHWRANANRREGRKADWLAAWRNWCRREVGARRGAPLAGPVAVPSAQLPEHLRRWAEKEEASDPY